MKILLTGATGYIGKRLLPILIAQGHEVICCVRDKNRFYYPKELSQKIKVIETLDRTKSVREVKLVFSTLAENFKYTSINKNAKKTIKEGIASKVVKSTKPAVARTVISESAQISDRFKKLAGIIK
jgi:putative NADH-flavin reductase